MHKIILVLLVAIYIIYFTTASFLRYENFYTGRFDLGNMTQTVWNTSQGRIFEFSDSIGTGVISRLSAHADFILILLAPFYLILPDPRMLTLILTVTLAMGAFFVYGISKIILKNKNLSLLFAFSYLMYPAIQYNNLYDFHAVSLATTFLLGSFYFLLRKKYILVTVFLILAALTKEQVWLIVALFGGYIFLLNKNNPKKMLGIVLFLISTFMFYYLIWHVIPYSRGGKHFALSYYSEFGNSPTKIVANILLSPQQIIETIFDQNRLNYLMQLFAPLGFLSIFSPLYLIFAIPDFAIALLSNNPQLYQIYYQYNSTITPFIFVSSIFGLKNLIRWFPKISQSYYVLYISLALLISCYFIGPLPGSKYPNLAMFTNPQANKHIIKNYLKSIPESYSISATNNLGAHLSHRKLIFNVPANMEKSDMVLFLVDRAFTLPSVADQNQMIEKMKNNSNYKKVFEKDNFVVFKRE